MPRPPQKTTKKQIDSIVMEAVAEHLGNISSLPSAVRYRIVEIYRDFFMAYLNIGRVKGISEDEVMEKLADLDQDLIDYMQHFFSDYQDLYRSFMVLNRHAKELLQVDRVMHPKRFEEKVGDLMAGRKQFSDDFVFNQLRPNQHLDERRAKDEQ